MHNRSCLRMSCLAVMLIAVLFSTGCEKMTGLFSSGPDPELVNVYNTYRTALIKGDLAALRIMLVKQKAQELDAPGAEQMLALARSMYPSNVSVTATAVQGDAATLAASAPVEGGSMNGVIHLLKEDGKWKIYDEKWEIKTGAPEQLKSSPPAAEKVPDNTRPYDYAKAVGVWTGHEAGSSGDHWTFTLQGDYEVVIEGPGGQRTKGTAMSDWNLGLEGNSMRVLPGGAIFDIRVQESPAQGQTGKLALGSFKLMGDSMQICSGEPGLVKRTSDFVSRGGIRCFELRKIKDLSSSLPQPVQQPQQPAQQQPQSFSTSSFSKQDPNVSGEAVVVKDGKSETYPLVTGFFSETRFRQAERAAIQFQAPAPEHSNARRIVMILDATKTGTHYADGKLLSDNFMNSDKIRIGEQTPHGPTASFTWVADGGQIFFPKTACIINITSAYSGSASGLFSGEVRDCQVHSAGIDYNISSVKFSMKGAPVR